MPRDLSKVKEVLSVSNRGQDFVNEKLKSGKWILLEMKIVEWNSWWKQSVDVGKAHLHKDHDTIYVIGRVK